MSDAASAVGDAGAEDAEDAEASCLAFHLMESLDLSALGVCVDI